MQEEDVIRADLGEVFHKLAAQKESRIEEGHLQPDHVHMLISILPKYAVSQVVGLLKGRVLSTSPVCTETGSEISLAKGSGLAGSLSPRWGATKP
jgi:REP element-mobilizing transposase RayT